MDEVVEQTGRNGAMVRQRRWPKAVEADLVRLDGMKLRWMLRRGFVFATTTAIAACLFDSLLSRLSGVQLPPLFLFHTTAFAWVGAWVAAIALDIVEGERIILRIKRALPPSQAPSFGAFIKRAMKDGRRNL